MQRKNITKCALVYMNSWTSMITAYQIMSDWPVTNDQDKLDKCHIYIIAKRPNP